MSAGDTPSPATDAPATDAAVVTPVRMEETPLERWIEQNLPASGKLGYDPWLHTVDGVARLEGIEGLAVVRFTAADVVRHPIVGRIVTAYEGEG